VRRAAAIFEVIRALLPSEPNLLRLISVVYTVDALTVLCTALKTRVSYMKTNDAVCDNCNNVGLMSYLKI